MQVIILENKNVQALEAQINQFLHESTYDIQDIKLVENGGNNSFLAMIIYA